VEGKGAGRGEGKKKVGINRGDALALKKGGTGGRTLEKTENRGRFY